MWLYQIRLLLADDAEINIEIEGITTRQNY